VLEARSAGVHALVVWGLHRDTAELEAAGASKILCAYDNGRMFGMAYLELSNGLYVELVDRASFADWKGFLAGKMEHEIIYPD